MTLKEQIRSWMAGREDEFVEALTPLIAINSITGEAAPGMPFGPGPAKALELALELARKWGMSTWEDEGYVGLEYFPPEPIEKGLSHALSIKP